MRNNCVAERLQKSLKRIYQQFKRENEKESDKLTSAYIYETPKHDKTLSEHSRIR